MANDVDVKDFMHDPYGRPLFFGLYEATVKNIQDPKKQNRIQVSVTITGNEVTNWAKPLLPITSNANHPDHQEHTAAQIAALLTTSSTTTSDPQGGSVTIPALTVVAKSGAGTLKHPRKTAANTTQKWNDAQEQTPAVAEHTPHRLLPKKGQKVWVMFAEGLPNKPVWVGVQ